MENESKLTAIQPLITPGLDILKEAWEIFKKTWKKFLGLIVIIPLISSLIGLAILVILFLVFLLVSFAIGGPAAAATATTATATLEMISSTIGALSLGNSASGLLAIIFGLIAVVVLIIFVFIPLTVGFYSTVFILREPELKAWDAFKKGLKFFWRYLWVIILMTLITLVGYALFIVPGIIFSIWFSFVMYVLLVENVGGLKALGRSRELVKGFWWTVFARLLIVTIFSLIISVVLNILNSPGGALFEAGGQFQQTTLTVIGLVIIFITFLVSLAVNFIVYSVIMIYEYLLYEKLKALKQKNSQAIDGMSGGKKFGLSLVIILPLIIIVLVLALLAIVGIGSFIQSGFSTSSSYKLQNNVLEFGSATDTSIIKADNILPGTTTQK
jgi:hypothetical protein